MAEKNTIYTVHAYRWGDKSNHSYPIGVYLKKHAAQSAAEAEEAYRGGKYECEICEWVIGKTKDNEPGMPYKIIKKYGVIEKK